MRVKKIEYPTPLSQVKDIENDNIDVFVELENGEEYVVVVSTPQNYYWYMEKEGIDYYCGCPEIIVKKITEDNIKRAIDEYAEGNAYWLKYYHLGEGIDINIMDEMIKKHRLE